MQDHLSGEPDELEEFENTHNILIISSGQQITRIIPELHLAAWTGDLETVKLLTDKEHQNPLQKDECGNTALHIAAWGGTLNVLKYFVNEKECNPACPGPSGKMPLHYASQHAHLDVVKYLVTEKQVEPLCEDESRWTPIINLAEAAFIFNLGVLSIWSLYGGSANTSSPNQYILTYTMVSIAMVKFALVIAYHVYHGIDWLWEWVKAHREKQNDDSQVHLFTISDVMSGNLSSEIEYVEAGTSTFLPVEKVEGEAKESKSTYIPVSVTLSAEGKGEVNEKGGEVKDETD